MAHKRIDYAGSTNPIYFGGGSTRMGNTNTGGRHMTRNPVANNRARWQGWTPSRRDRFEQWLCRELDKQPNLYICRAAWFGWLDQQWREWQAMQREMGWPKNWERKK